MFKTTLAAAALLAMTSIAHADNQQRGFDALKFIDANFRLPRGLYAEHITPGKPAKGNSSAWSSGVMLSALNAAGEIEAKRIPQARAYATALDAYKFQMPGHPMGYQPYPGNVPDELFYDDNAWFVLAFLDTARLTNHKAFIDRAKVAFDFVASGESDRLGGGLYWSSKKGSKNTCTNAPAICGALSLYDVTKDAKYLAQAERWYAWTSGKLQDPSDGLFWDNISLAGKVEETKWSYNSALMIRANVMLSRATNDPKYLLEANRIADSAEKKWFREDGALTDEGSFAHLLVEALLELHEAKPRPETVKKVNRALDKLAEIGRDNGYPKRWDGWRADEKRIELLQQASAARAFLFASKRSEATTQPAK